MQLSVPLGEDATFCTTGCRRYIRRSHKTTLNCFRNNVTTLELESVVAVQYIQLPAEAEPAGNAGK
ncbi:unnamed protein product, partial [Iphiclides podalirius]